MDGSTTLGVMASSVVVGLVVGLRVQDDRWRLDLSNLILLEMKGKEIELRHRVDLREEGMFVRVSFRGTYEVSEEGAVVSKLRRKRNGFLANTNTSTD